MGRSEVEPCMEMERDIYVANIILGATGPSERRAESRTISL